jgi:hypothetical protein
MPNDVGVICNEFGESGYKQCKNELGWKEDHPKHPFNKYQ